MITSPIYDASRKVMNFRTTATSVRALSTSSLAATGKRLLTETVYRFDPYALPVLAVRDYPTPVQGSGKQVAAKPSGIVPLSAEDLSRSTAAAVASTRKQAAAPAIPHEATPVKPSKVRTLIEFKRGEDIYVADTRYKVGDYVVVQGDRGEDMGHIRSVLPAEGPSIAKVVRVATEQEKQALLELRAEENSAARLCQQRIREHNLRMKVEDVEFQYDGGKITIYYSSTGPVDFRQLQRQLFRDFRCRVWFTTVPASSKPEF